MDAIQNNAMRQEMAYRRGVHQSLARARVLVERCRTLADARDMFGRLEDAAQDARNDRMPVPTLIDEITKIAQAS